MDSWSSKEATTSDTDLITSDEHAPMRATPPFSPPTVKSMSHPVISALASFPWLGFLLLVASKPTEAAEGSER